MRLPAACPPPARRLPAACPPDVTLVVLADDGDNHFYIIASDNNDYRLRLPAACPPPARRLPAACPPPARRLPTDGKSGVRSLRSLPHYLSLVRSAPHARTLRRGQCTPKSLRSASPLLVYTALCSAPPAHPRSGRTPSVLPNPFARFGVCQHRGGSPAAPVCPRGGSLITECACPPPARRLPAVCPPPARRLPAACPPMEKAVSARFARSLIIYRSSAPLPTRERSAEGSVHQKVFALLRLYWCTLPSAPLPPPTPAAGEPPLCCQTPSHASGFVSTEGVRPPLPSAPEGAP